jgi:membrane-bound serine protease (ClpP class)
MSKRLALWSATGALALGLGGAVHAAVQTPAAVGGRPLVVELRIGDEIEPVLAEFVTNGIHRAADEHASLVLITMDTPGGLEESMKAIITAILDSPVPVAVYVSPAGARGASAGFFILESADIAAMAPGTHAGAASPVMAIGGFPVTVDPTLERKIMNDATAYLRSYAGKRGHDVTLAETAITQGKAFTDQEALDGKLVDLVVASTDDLLARLNGRTVTRFDGRTTTLDLSSPSRDVLSMTGRERFLARIVQPDVFFVLLIVGVLGLYTEFTHPGMFAPGVVGGIALVLALYAMHILPVNFTGLLLILLALALFILEANYPSHGILGIGGVVSMVLGAVMLVRSPITGGGVSLGVALGVAVPFALIAVVLMRLVLRSRAWKPATGVEQLVGAEGDVTEDLHAGAEAGGAPRGQVFVHGELWRAVATAPIPRGTHVRVVNVEGLTLHVEPAGPPGSAA